MQYKDRSGKAVTTVLICILLGFSFFVMPPVLAAVPGNSRIQSVSLNQTNLGAAEAVQTADINAVSKKTAVESAIAALKEQGFDMRELKSQPVEVRYIAESAPAGDPVWAVIFRSDEKGYAYVFGDDINSESRKKLAALGRVEDCTGADGTPGIRAYYSYTRYTLVEINAFSGAYIRHGNSVAAYGEVLNLEETHWLPSSEEDWTRQLEKQNAVEKSME